VRVVATGFARQQMMRMVLIIALLGLVLGTAACGKKSAGMFDKLYASDFGLGVTFEQTGAQVRAVLGEPPGRTERQGGVSVTDVYLAKDETELDGSSPQLSVTYLQDKMVRLYNRYYPEDEKRQFPPFFMELLPGVKLGHRKSDFVTALGMPPEGPDRNEWRFSAKDGRQIIITAAFVEVPKAGEPLCCTLQVALVPATEEKRGEEYEKQQEIQRKLHDKNNNGNSTSGSSSTGATGSGAASGTTPPPAPAAGS
jgi:hypothetical protein